MKKCLLLIFTTLICLNAHATHIVGGEVSYAYTPDGYQFTLKIYRDCYNGVPSLDDPAYLAIYTGNGELFDEYNLPLLQEDTVVIPDLGACISIPAGHCVEMGLYQLNNVALPFNENGYYAVYQRCCRNQIIDNIELPQDAGATYAIFISAAALLLNNSSPVWKNVPPALFCIHLPLGVDHSAIDPEGDEIRYQFCEPLNGATPDNPQPTVPSGPPFDTIPFVDGYSRQHPMKGDPLISIDSLTGVISGTPDQLGHFVFSVCGEEYRDGVLLTRFYRDYQFVVSDCIQNNVTISLDPAVHTQCDTTYDFYNIIAEGPNGPFSYIWSTGATTEDITNVVPGATYTVTVVDAASCFSIATLSGNDCVWPGDTDYNGVANNMDVLNIGLFYAAFGTQRDNATNEWTPQQSPNWSGYQSNGINYKHIDCDGSGWVNRIDVNAIDYNYNLSHPTIMMPATVDAPQLRFTFDKNYLIDSTSVINGSIWLGEASKPIEKAYGIALTIRSNRTDANLNITANFEPTVFGGLSQTVYLAKSFPELSRTDIAVSNISRFNINAPYGKVCDIQIKSQNGVPGPVELGFSQIRLIDNNGEDQPVNFIPSVVTVGQTEPTITAGAVQIIPNPTRNQAQLVFGQNDNSDAMLLICDHTGRVIRSEQHQNPAGSILFDTKSLQNGAYLIKVIQQNRVYTGKLVVAN